VVNFINIVWCSFCHAVRSFIIFRERKAIAYTIETSNFMMERSVGNN